MSEFTKICKYKNNRKSKKSKKKRDKIKLSK